MKRLPVVVLILAGLLAATPVSTQSSTPVGVWQHANGRIEVQIAPCNNRLCGRLVWLKRPNDAQGRPRIDFKNPDPALRWRPLLGLTVLHGLRRIGERMWGDGEIYNPDDGMNYKALISVETDGTLHVHAYVLFPLLGQTQIWTRVR